MTGQEQVDTSNMSPQQIAQMQQQNCIFCHIVSGKVQSKKVYDDEETIGILDINPANPGHVLVLPKKHHAIMPQMDDFEIGHIFSVSKHISGALLKALRVDGTNIFVANGTVAGQKAPHFMVHIIPRKGGDGLDFSVPENKIQPDELLKVRDMLLPKIKEHLGLTEENIQNIMSGPAPKPVQEAEAPQIAENVPEPTPVQLDPQPTPAIQPDNQTADLDAISNILNQRQSAPVQEQPVIPQELPKEESAPEGKIKLTDIKKLFKQDGNV